MSAHAIRYLIDSNVFIEAHRRYYAFDLCPGFWNSLVWLHNRGHVLSLDKVRDEIGHEGDALVQWASNTMPATGFVISSDAATVDWYRQIQTWANTQSQYTAAARDEFARVADAWLIAHAKANSFTLVTHEDNRPNARKKIFIPTVCHAFQVECTDTFKMLINLGVKFNWQEQTSN